MDRDIAEAVRALGRGGIVAYPTEAVFGLGCDPDDEAAIQRLLALKQRAPDKGLILIAAEFEALRPYLGRISTEVRDRALATWPGPTTWVLPAGGRAGRLVTGGRDSVAVRVTAHRRAAALCRAWGGALVSTSANPAGSAPARDAEAVRRYFGERLDSIVGGATGGLERPSEIYDGRSGRRLR